MSDAGAGSAAGTAAAAGAPGDGKATAETAGRRPGRPGGPSMMLPAQKAKLLQALRTGAPRVDCALAAGIGRSTFLRWIARGKRSKTGEYRAFWDEVRAAQSEGKVALSALIVREAQSGDWRAAAWILERRHGKEYGRREHHTVAGDKDAPAVFTLDIGNLPGGGGGGEGERE